MSPSDRGYSTDAAKDGFWAKSGVPKRHALALEGKEVELPEWQQARRKIHCNALTGYIYALIGPRGTGKTHMAVSLIHRRIFERGRNARYLTAMDFFVLLKESYRNEDIPGERDITASLVLPSLLVIDEVTVRSDSTWENNMLTHLIGKRYDAMKDTIVIGNLKPEEIVSSLGASIASRMEEVGGILNCSWPSFRSKP